MGRPAINILGKRFGRLIVLSCKGLIGKEMKWLCICDCGVKKAVTGNNLRSGNQTSCGCFQKEPQNNPAFVHGQCRRIGNTKEYRAYQSAKTRCTNPNRVCYDSYGGRGIKFRFTSFEQFFRELGPAPSAKHSVDRINNDKDYAPGNVRWSTSKEQVKNRRKLGSITRFTTEELETELTRRKNVRPN